ncbi:MAG: hypothetical protein DRJ08_01920 [Acidobacteria bacterium]|nr:MAG: hypothetical protein DRJ08_01920 [Acidobacteriota bacterium]
MMVSFEKWLKKTRQVPESAIRWYVRWVEMCLSDANIPTGKPIPKRKAESFLHEIGQEREDWQLLQAEKALKLGCFICPSPFLNIAFQKRYGVAQSISNDLFAFSFEKYSVMLINPQQCFFLVAWLHTVFHLRS